MTDLQIKIIKCYARNNMKLQKTADEMHYHRNSILYQMSKIENETGLNPHNFCDLWKLLFSLMGGDLNDLRLHDN